jgi:predicted phosphodiesterase
MWIQYLSDIHLEFYKGSIPKVDRLLLQIIPVAPICVLAGDIGYPFEETYRHFLSKLSAKFEHIVLIHGNHEYYQLGGNKGKSMQEIVQQTEAICEALPNVHFLNDSYWDYQGVRFIGSVLWSELKDPQHLVNDVNCIPEFSMGLSNQLYSIHKTWLDNAISSADSDVVVVTHHLPSMELVAAQWKGHPVNQCFASDSDSLIRPPVKLWIYGHTHQPSDTVYQGIRCIANPIGYPGENPKPNLTQKVIL